MGWFNRKKKIEETIEKIPDPCKLDGVKAYLMPPDYFVEERLPILVIEDKHFHMMWIDGNMNVRYSKVSTSPSTNYFSQVKEGVYLLSGLSSIEDFVVPNETTKI